MYPVAYPGSVSWLPGNPPGHDFFVNQGVTTLLAPTSTSQLNFDFWKPSETNSGYATGILHILRKVRSHGVPALTDAVDTILLHNAFKLLPHI